MDARRPGQFLEEQIQRKAMIAGAGVALVWGLAALGWFRWWPAALIVIPAVFLVDRLVRDGRRLDPSRQLGGLEGEQLAGAALVELAPQGVLAVHDLSLERGNVDHVAITPSGVFAIEVKHLAGGRFYIRRGMGLMQGDRPADRHAAQARRNASTVHDLLAESGIDVWVDPLLVSTKADVWRGAFRIGRVHVLTLERLRDALFEGPECLDASRRQLIFETLLAADAGHR
ncbi:MAG: nuclease-related domain-containing protein [Actinomycetota bacterium]